MLGAVGCFEPITDDIAAIYYYEVTIVGFLPSTLGLKMDYRGC